MTNKEDCIKIISTVISSYIDTRHTSGKYPKLNEQGNKIIQDALEYIKRNLK